MNIAFAQPTAATDVDWFPSIAPGYLSAWLDRYVPVDGEACRAATAAECAGADIVAISATSQDYDRAREFARAAREVSPHALIVLGGHHITFLPETLAPEFDVGVVGEGEETFGELVAAVAACGGAPWLYGHDLAPIRGIVRRDWERGGVTMTARREPIMPLDRVPHPGRWPGDAPYIFSSRGCPYGCTFCGSRPFWGRTRFFSAGYVVDEIAEVLRDFPAAGSISIQDDLFIAHRPRLEQIVALLIERKLSHVKPFGFAVRANLVTDGLCESVKRIWTGGVCFGAESGSDRVMAMAGKGVTVEQNQRALDTLRRHGLTVGCSFIVGWPDETEADVRATYDFIRRNVDAGKLAAGPGTIVNILSPLPGTKVWADALRAGKVSVPMRWGRLGGYASWRSSKHASFDDWAAHRLANRSVYLGGVSQDRLFAIMQEYESEIPR